MEQHLIKHFQSLEHIGFIEDVCITLSDKTDPFISTKRNDYWTEILKTWLLMVLTLKKMYIVSDYSWCFYLDFSFYFLMSDRVCEDFDLLNFYCYYCNMIRTQNHLIRKVGFAKWLSVRLQTKWFWVRIRCSHLNFRCLPVWSKEFLNIQATTECKSLYNAYEAF